MRGRRWTLRRRSCRSRRSSRPASPRRRPPDGGAGETASARRPGDRAMKVAEIRELSVEVLRDREKELDDQLFRLRIQKSMGQLEAPAKVRDVRRDLARIKTILQEKETAASGG